MTKKILIDEAVVKQVLKKIAKAKELCDKQSKLDRRVVYGNVLIEHFDTICQVLEVNNKGVNALAEQSDYNICPACGGIASDPIVPVEARQQAAEPGRFVVVDRRTTPSGRHSHTVESDWPLPIGAILHTHPAHTQQPLTDEQIIKCWGQVEGTRHGYVSFARAIEAAHGITSKKGGAA